MHRPSRLYGWLLKLYPAGFREEYEAPMERQFQDDYRDTQGRLPKVRLWLRAVADLAASIPRELARELSLDLKHSVRLYRKRPFTTALAVAVLGLAIGAGTGVFSVLNALLLRQLPFSHPEKLVELVVAPVSAMNGRTAFLKWQQESQYLESAATFNTSDMNLTEDRDALRVKVTESSANFFSVLGVSARIGRTFAREEDASGHSAIAVISYGLWQQSFAGDPGVCGRTIRVNGVPMTVIGVTPPGFDYPAKTNLWLPSVFDFEKVPKRGAFLMQTVGRLKPGVSLHLASQLLEADARRANPHGPQSWLANDPNRPRLSMLRNQLGGQIEGASLVLAGLTLLVLLAACANVSQVLLSRTAERQQEMAVRIALGASRARLLQQLLTEATVLTVAGSCIGVLVAWWVAKIASAVAAPQLATQSYTVLDWRVLGFVLSLAILTGIVLGALPGWVVARVPASQSALRSQSSARDSRATRAQWTLLCLQASLAVALITSSLTLGLTFLKLIHEDLGFDTAGLVSLNVSTQGTRNIGRGEWAYDSAALNRLRAVPGVVAAGAVSHLPLANDIYMAFALKLDSGQKVSAVVVNAASPGYFEAMGTSLLAGADFGVRASGELERAVVVNEAFAEKSSLGLAVVGRNLLAPWSNAPYRIAGVVRTVRTGGPASSGIPQVYWQIQEEPPPALTLVAKVSGTGEDFLARCKAAVASVDRTVPVYDVQTLEERLSETLSRPKFYTNATLFLALLATLLAAAGIFGASAYAVAQRQQEIGIRVAIGATHQRIRWMIMLQSLTPVALGTVAGIGFAGGVGPVFAAFGGGCFAARVRDCDVGCGCVAARGIHRCLGRHEESVVARPAGSHPRRLSLSKRLQRCKPHSAIEYGHVFGVH